MPKLKAKPRLVVVKPAKGDAPEWSPPLLEDWLEEVEDVPQWLIENFIPEEGMTLVSGQQKLTRKSFTAFAASLAVATGKTIGPFKPLRQGHVLYIEEEGTKAPTKNRWQAFLKGLGIKKHIDIRFAFRDGVGLDDDKWRARLLEYVAYYEPAMIVFDNLSFMHGGDENSNNDMRTVVNTLQLIRNAGTATLFLAHLSKIAGSDPKEDMDKQVRGGSIVANGYDVHWALRKYTPNEHAPIELFVRYRDLGGRQYTVNWDLKHQKGSELLDTIGLIMKERYDEWDPRFAAECMTLLERGKQYGVEDLKRIWKCSRQTAQSVADRLVAATTLTFNKQTGRFAVP